MKSIRIYEITSPSEYNASKLYENNSKIFYWNTRALGNINVGDGIFVIYNKEKVVLFTIVEKNDIPYIENGGNTFFEDSGKEYTVNGVEWGKFARLRIAGKADTMGDLNMYLTQNKKTIIYENKTNRLNKEQAERGLNRLNQIKKVFAKDSPVQIVLNFCTEYIKGNPKPLPELSIQKWFPIEIIQYKESIKPYSVEKAMEGLFVERNKLEEIIKALKYKKNIILQGPPGVGKTFLAKRIAYAIMGIKDKSRIEMVQFHQSYSYEDFIEGIRPDGSGNFCMKSGVFKEFCETAQDGRDYFFIIDEINRGNLSKIFGELMMLIEADKRGRDFSIPLTYSKNRNDRFYIPENVYIIGTMNTADRSLALVDYALRRRFSFFDIEPNFTDSFKNYLTDLNINAEIVNKIFRKMLSLNQTIKNESRRLGPGFQIGHSYFCGFKDNMNAELWFRDIINQEIKPLIREYWFDDEDKINEEIAKLDA